MNEFSARIKNKTFVVSPFMLYCVLVLLFIGSEDSTQKELQTILRFVDKNQILDAITTVFITIKATNKLLLNNTMTCIGNIFPETSYIQQLNGLMKFIDVSDTSNSAKTINEKISEFTNQLFKNTLVKDVSNGVLLFSNIFANVSILSEQHIIDEKI